MPNQQHALADQPSSPRIPCPTAQLPSNSNSLLRYALIFLTASTVAHRPSLANNQMAVSGTPPTHVLQTDDFDRIDLLNGSLHFSHLLFSAQVNADLRYELRLSYSNGNMWMTDPANTTAGERLALKSTVGLGFKLHFGRIYKLCDDNCDWFYEDPSGTAHRLFLENVGGVDYYWSKDLTFLRARQNGPSTWELQLPDGTLYNMDHFVSGNLGLPNRLLTNSF